MTFLEFRSTHQPLGQKAIFTNGGYSLTRYWFRGEIFGLMEFGATTFINGMSGKETVVDVSSIKPAFIE